MPLDFSGRRRRKAARKKPGPKPWSRNVRHGTRRSFSKARPLQVTSRMDRSVRNLRTRALYAVLYSVFCRTCDLGVFRIIQYSVQRNHLHFIIEAGNREAMSRGMQRVGTCIAMQLNKAMGRRKGRVLGDRYHELHLESPRQVRNALHYVLNNFRKHYWKDERRTCEKNWVDPFSSAEFFAGWKERPCLQVPLGGPVAPARTWLLTVGWRKGGLLRCDLIPTPALAGVRQMPAV